MTREEWLAYGIEHGYCSEPECDTHGGLPATAEELDRFERGEDPCTYAVRVWREGKKAATQ